MTPVRGQALNLGVEREGLTPGEGLVRNKSKQDRHPVEFFRKAINGLSGPRFVSNSMGFNSNAKSVLLLIMILQLKSSMTSCSN